MSTLQKPELIEDLYTLATLIESIHPDPYRGFGGRINLYRRLEELVENMPEEASPETFFHHVLPLVSDLQDLHTTLSPPEDHSDEVGVKLPVSLRVIGSSIFVDGVFDEAETNLLGGRVTMIDGVPVEMVMANCNGLYGENRYGKRLQIVQKLESYEMVHQLLNLSTPPESLTLRVKLGNKPVERTMEPIPNEQKLSKTLIETVVVPSGTGPRFQLYENGSVALFNPGDLLGYRESLETKLVMGAGEVDELASFSYKNHVGGEQPSKLCDIIAELPSMMKT